MDKSIRKLDYIIETTAELINLYEKYHSESGDVQIIVQGKDIFFLNCLVRFKEILNSVQSLSTNFKINRISIFILLRPLLLDCLFYNFIFKLVSMKEPNKRNGDIDRIINDCMKDGIKQYYLSTVFELKSHEKYSNTSKEEALKNIADKYAAFISDSSNLWELKFFEPEFKIKASYLKKELDKLNIICPIFAKNYFLYDFFSKHDHNTIISLEYYSSKELNGNIFDESISIIYNSFIYLIKTILNESTTNEDYFNEIFSLHYKYEQALIADNN